MIKTGSLFFLALNFLWSSWGYGAVTVTAEVNRQQVAVGDQFTLKVSVSSDDNESLSEPSLPVIDNVQMLHRSVSTQSRMSFVSKGQGGEFQTVRTKVHSYHFSVLQQKDITIDPVQVEVEGKTYTTAPITIRVVDASLAQPAPQGQGQPSMPGFPDDFIEDTEELFNQLLNRQFGGVPGGHQTTGNSKKPFMIIAEVDKTEAFKGEQITASWYLYTRGRVADIDTLKYPTLKGFWKEDIQISTQLNFEQDVVNGVPWSRALLASYALFPIDEGKQVIDPYTAKATIRSGFGFGQGRASKDSSKSIPVLIKPLPKEGQPLDFTGAVGQFQFTVEPPRGTIVTHQPFPLKVRFEGRGNAKLIELPELPLGDSLEIYDIKNESRYFKNGQSFKEFEVLLVPREPGDLTIGALKTSFFDPTKEQYVSLQSEPIKLRVMPGAKQESIGEERLKSNQEKKTLPGLITEYNPETRAAGFPLWVWPLLFALAVLVLAIKAVMDSGILRKAPSLEDVIKLRFGRVERLLEKSQIRNVGIEATNTVYLALGNLSGEGGASEELDKLLAKTTPSVRREIEQPLTQMIDYFGVLGFGPTSYVKDFKDMTGLKKKVSELKTLLLRAYQLSKGHMEKDEK